MDVIFILDIGLNFRTAFVEDAVLIADKQRIMRSTRKWLAIDVVAAGQLLGRAAVVERGGLRRRRAAATTRACARSSSGSRGRSTRSTGC